MKAKALLVIGCVATFATACGGSVYSVSAKAEDGGIPFFPMRAVQTNTFLLEQSWWQIDLEVTRELVVPAAGAKNANEPKPKPKAMVSTHRIYTTDPAAAAKLALAFNAQEDAPAAYGAVKAIFINPAAPYQVTPPPEVYDVNQACVDARFRMVGVDSVYRQVPALEARYLNVTIPALGSAESAIELNSNGTLKSVSAKSDSKAAEVIGAGIGAAATVLTPLAGAVAGRFIYDGALALEKLKKETPAVKSALPVIVVVDAKLTVTPARQVLTITENVDPPDVTRTCPKNRTGLTYSSRTELGKASAEPAKSEEENAVSFAGQIKLPKEPKSDDAK